MSAIDELNNALEINASGGNVEVVDNSSAELELDATSNELKTTKINMNQATANTVRHKFVKQELKRTPESMGGKKIQGVKRTVVPQSNIPVEPEKEIQEVHLSPMDDMIGVENPNSMLSKWVKNKEEEAREWIAEKEEEKAVLAEEGEDEEGTIGVIVEDNDDMTVIDRRTLVEDDDLDINYTKPSEEPEEEENMNEENTDILDQVEIEEDEELDLGLDLEAPEVEVEEDEGANDSVSDSNISDNKEIEIEEEAITFEDLDIEESTEEAAPIIVVDEEDKEDEEEDNASDDQDTDEVLKNLQKMVTEKIKPISTKLDLSSFTIVKKPVSNINNALSDASSRVIKWVLPNQGAVVKVKDFTGAELEKLREYSENTSSVDSLNRRYKLIYDHIVSPKPQNFDTWLKCTPFSDIDHYFFAIYIANYKGANFLPVDCTNEKCGNTWVTDDINVMEMVKFATNEDKEKFDRIYHSEETAATGKGLYVSQVVAISNKFAIAFREPSIYSIIEDRLIDSKTRTKYSSFIDYLPYIDSIYLIDQENKSLTPISYKEFPDNATRNIKSKIHKYSTIFDSFGADEFGPVRAYIRAISARTDGVSYNFPELTCPKCGQVIKPETTMAEALVFTRYQLGSLTSTLLN